MAEERPAACISLGYAPETKVGGGGEGSREPGIRRDSKKRGGRIMCGVH
jgi:hypothetical protein